MIYKSTQSYTSVRGLSVHNNLLLLSYYYINNLISMILESTQSYISLTTGLSMHDMSYSHAQPNTSETSMLYSIIDHDIYLWTQVTIEYKNNYTLKIKLICGIKKTGVFLMNMRKISNLTGHACVSVSHLHKATCRWVYDDERKGERRSIESTQAVEIYIMNNCYK